MALVAAAMLALAAVASLPQRADASPESLDRDLRIITYNIHHGEGIDDVYDLDRIAAVIRDSGADIATLQEVDRHLLERSNFED